MKPTADRYIRKAELTSVGIPYSPDHAIRLAKRGLFPKPIRLSSRRTVWRLSDLQAWIAQGAQNAAA